MTDYRRVILFIMVTVSFIYATQFGPWSHFKAITSDIDLIAGDTLTISAGTEVRFSPGTKLNILGGVVISNGTSSDPVIFGALDPNDPSWGGIFINNSDPLQVSTFNSTIFTKMYSYGDGPISIGDQSSIDFINCRFIDNHADYNGGAVYVSSGNVNFITCIFRNNSAENGGGLYIYNNPSAAPSNINLNYCSFLANSASNGGGLYIKDYDGASDDMFLSIQNTRFHYNKANDPGGLGGGLFINILARIDLKLKYCKIQYNDATLSGGGIYSKYFEMDYGANNIQPQEFSNLLITQNSAKDGGGVYFSTGFTQNPANIDFINTTIAFNKVTTSQQENDGGGIHIVSKGNYPLIKNTILWGNSTTGEWGQVFISDNTYPTFNAVFPFCDIQEGDWFGYEGLVVDPKFIRPPLIASNTLLAADRFDYHLSLNSDCIDAGDPTTPINPIATREVNYPPVNIGAYGNTKQASVPLSSITPIPAGTVSDLTIPAGGVVVLDFEGKLQTVTFNCVILNEGSQLHLKGSNLANINITDLLTPIQPEGKYFNDERIVIQKLIETDLTTQTLNITGMATLHGVELSDMQLNITGIAPEVNINNSKIYNSDTELLSSGISATDPLELTIINSSIDNFKTGIEVIYTGPNKNKGSKRITNNTITFDPGETQKLGQQIGIQVQNAYDMKIEDNDIDNGEIGIRMSSSSGRITNNTVTFDPGETQKNKLLGRIAIDVIGGTDAILEDNDIWITDTTTLTAITGINVENSSAKIYYNKINFADAGAKVRNGIVFNNVFDSTYAYNNTIYNASNGVNITSGLYGIDLINNIIWNDGSMNIDTTDVKFYNNDIKYLPIGIVGTGNISSDPLCIDPSTNDLIIGTSSPCMDAGLVVSDFHYSGLTYFGSAPEIGAVEYYVEFTAPENPTVSVSGSTFTFGWDPVPGALSYSVYSSDDPYGTYVLETVVASTSWDATISSAKRFYYVAANDESKNVGYVRETIPYDEVKKDENNTVIKKRIPRKIKRTNSSR
ncbi:MAG: hypothetical protein PF638_10250 [Candidatus Delongbacteria bacterium]|jgi:parallel beta-helix repeat protein|nr:hypothetical protein [Candidatus Delongbacteria bacterium]